MADRASKRYGSGEASKKEAESKKMPEKSAPAHDPKAAASATPANGGAQGTVPEATDAIFKRHATERKQTHERHDRERQDMHKRHNTDHSNLDKRHQEEMAAAQMAAQATAPAAGAGQPGPGGMTPAGPGAAGGTPGVGAPLPASPPPTGL